MPTVLLVNNARYLTLTAPAQRAGFVAEDRYPEPCLVYRSKALILETFPVAIHGLECGHYRVIPEGLILQHLFKT